MDQPGLGFKQCSFDHVGRVLQSDASTGLLVLRFTDMLWSPTPFPVSGKSVDPGRFWFDCLLSEKGMPYQAKRRTSACHN
jgi:hypothetical protein